MVERNLVGFLFLIKSINLFMTISASHSPSWISSLKLQKWEEGVEGKQARKEERAEMWVQLNGKRRTCARLTQYNRANVENTSYTTWNSIVPDIARFLLECNTSNLKHCGVYHLRCNISRNVVQWYTWTLSCALEHARPRVGLAPLSRALPPRLSMGVRSPAVATLEWKRDSNYSNAYIRFAHPLI